MWERISEKRGKLVSELRDRPKCPPEFQYLWEMYADIKRGCENVGVVEIDAYCRLAGEKLTRREVNLLLKIEQARIGVRYD